MNARERFNRVMHFQPVDHVPDEEFGYWDETLQVWHMQGLPREIDDNGKAKASQKDPLTACPGDPSSNGITAGWNPIAKLGLMALATPDCPAK